MIFIVILCLFQTLQIVETNVFVELLLTNFINPDGLDSKGKYCDTGILNGCDTKFSICFGLSKDGCKKFSPPKEFTNTDNINFASENNDNRLFVQEIKEPYKENIFINVEVIDVDNIVDDLIDQFIHEENVKVSFNKTVAKFTSFKQFGNFYKYSRSTIQYDVKVYCSPNYFGKDCNNYCEVTSNSNYLCSINGEKICKLNWFTENCTVFCQIKNKENYKCDQKTGEKICLPDYYGINCDNYCEKKGINYICNNTTGEKICKTNYYGENCETFCNASASNYYCNKTNGNMICNENYFGKHCKFCKNDPLKKMYTCNKETGDKECNNYYYGPNCTTYCNTYNNSKKFKCNISTGEQECFSNYYGKNCSTFCSANNETDNYICNKTTGQKLCFDNYYGENCSVYCTTNNNNTNYICKSSTGDKECLPDYYGKNCSIFCSANNETANYICNKITGEKIFKSSVQIKINLERFDTSGSNNRGFNGVPCNILYSACSFKFEICYGSSSLYCFFTRTLTQEKNSGITRFPLDLSNNMTNPLVLKSSSQKVNFSLIVTVYTMFYENEKCINLYNRLSSDLTLDSFGVKSHVITGGMDPKISNEISFTTSFHCDDNYKPPHCVEKICIEHDDDINGHFTCSNNGTITCREGWTDPPKKCLVSTQVSYSIVGCYNDLGLISGKRIFPTFVNYRWFIDWSNVTNSLKNITMMCSSYAKDNGFKYFGMQFWGECWTGATPVINFIRDGESTDCWPSLNENLGPMIVGRDSTIMVYKWNKLKY